MSPSSSVLCSVLALYVAGSCVCAHLGDITILVAEKTSELRGTIYNINMTSEVIKTVPLFKSIRPVAVAYDDVTERMYWSDVMSKEIRRSRIDGSSEETFLHVNTDAIVDGFTIDTTNRLLFYADTGNDVIVKVPLDSPEQKQVVLDSSIDKPRGIMAFAPKKLLIWTDWTAWASIKKCKYDGTELQTLVNTDIQWPNGITFDSESETVYWCDAGLDKIESVRIDGTQRKVFLTETGTHYYSIFLFEDILYLTDWNTKAVRLIAINGTEISSIKHQAFAELTGIFVFRMSRYRGEQSTETTDDSSQKTQGYRGEQTTETTADSSQTTQGSTTTYGVANLGLIERGSSVGSLRSSPTTKSPAVVGLGVGIAAFALITAVVGFLALKYRRENKRLKTYDHLHYQNSTSTGVTSCSQDYTDMESPSDMDPCVCPDILSHNTPPEWRGEGTMLCEDEPRYISVASLNT